MDTKLIVLVAMLALVLALPNGAAGLECWKYLVVDGQILRPAVRERPDSPFLKCIKINLPYGDGRRATYGVAGHCEALKISMWDVVVRRARNNGDTEQEIAEFNEEWKNEMKCEECEQDLCNHY